MIRLFLIIALSFTGQACKTRGTNSQIKSVEDAQCRWDKQEMNWNCSCKGDMSQTSFTLPENFFDGQDDTLNNQLICESYGSVYPVEQDDYWYSNKTKTRGIFKVFFKGSNNARTCTFLPEDDHIKVNNVVDSGINTDVTIRNQNSFNRKFKAKCFDDIDSEVSKIRLIEQTGASWILDTARYKIDLTRNISHQ